MLSTFIKKIYDIFTHETSGYTLLGFFSFCKKLRWEVLLMIMKQKYLILTKILKFNVIKRIRTCILFQKDYRIEDSEVKVINIFY